MKRRKFFRAAAAIPAAPLLAGQAPPANSIPRPTSPAPPPADATTPPAPYNRTPGMSAEMPKLEISVADEVADMQPKFFTAAQIATLRKLSDILMPAGDETPGALAAGAPEFLDFLLSESPADRQHIYRTGLDRLNADAMKRFRRSFASLETEQAVQCLAPLKQPWSFDPPSDPLTRFLHDAKRDVRTATLNSKEYALAAESAGSRRGAGMGLYWFPID